VLWQGRLAALFAPLFCRVIAGVTQKIKWHLLKKQEVCEWDFNLETAIGHYASKQG
jgi:hypothetical protein